MPKKQAQAHEQSDANARGLMWVAIALVIGSIFMHIGLNAFFIFLRQDFQGKQRPVIADSLVRERRSPPPPLLQTNPSADLQKYQVEEERILTTYGWVDRKAGIVRIPIERAMEIMAHGK